MMPCERSARSARAAAVRDRIWQALQAHLGKPMPSNAALAAAAGCTAETVANALEFFRDRALIEITNDGRRRGAHICGGGELLPAPIGRTTDRSRQRRAAQAQASVSPRALTLDGLSGHEMRYWGHVIWRQGDGPHLWTQRLVAAGVSYAPPGGDPKPVEPAGGGVPGLLWRRMCRAAGTFHPDFRAARRDSMQQDRRTAR